MGACTKKKRVKLGADEPNKVLGELMLSLTFSRGVVVDQLAYDKSTVWIEHGMTLTSKVTT